MFTDHHNTSVTNVHAQRTMWRGAEVGIVSSDPPLNPSGTATKKIMILKKKEKKVQSGGWEASRQLLRDGTLVCKGGLCFPVSSLPLLLSVCPPSLAHCLDPDRKPGRPGPESERRLFLLLCDCFLFTPAAILHAPGGPVLIRVPACSRAVPEGCVATTVFPKWEEKGKSGRRWRVWVVVEAEGVCVCVCVWGGEVVQSEVK